MGQFGVSSLPKHACFYLYLEKTCTYMEKQNFTTNAHTTNPNIKNCISDSVRQFSKYKVHLFIYLFKKHLIHHVVGTLYEEKVTLFCFF